jgi:hypothetical protein
MSSVEVHHWTLGRSRRLRTRHLFAAKTAPTFVDAHIRCDEDGDLAVTAARDRLAQSQRLRLTLRIERKRDALAARITSMRAIRSWRDRS